MLIDITCTIIFDCNGLHEAGRGKANLHRIFTFRFETDNNDAPAKYTAGDPQNPKTSWSIDTDGIFFGLMSWGTDTELVKRAAKWPTDYCSDIAEGERLQADIEASEAAQ